MCLEYPTFQLYLSELNDQTTQRDRKKVVTYLQTNRT